MIRLLRSMGASFGVKSAGGEVRLVPRFVSPRWGKLTDNDLTIIAGKRD